jgi:crotonobetainyl-CoA:carnitine CoA-transferase CaiB-like acyl-CoA transferase
MSCLQGFHYWPELCRVIKRPDLVTDERFSTAQALRDNAPEAASILDEIFASATLAGWSDRLSDFKGQWTPVLDSVEIISDEQVTANGYMIESETKDGTRFPLVATPVQFDGQPSPTRRAPEFNEHGDDILTGELGLDWETVVELKVKGIVA